MSDRRFFTRKAAAGYGARLFLKCSDDYTSGGDSVRKMHDVLKTLSHWGGSDKRENFGEEIYLGYEMDQDLCDALATNLRKRGWDFLTERQLVDAAERARKETRPEGKGRESR
jgi:hypothetical protein